MFRVLESYIVQLNFEPLEMLSSLRGKKQTTLCEFLSRENELEFHPINYKLLLLRKTKILTSLY